MPAPKTPAPPATMAPGVAAEILDTLLGGRAGWSSTERGWHHKKTGLNIEARGGSCPFHVTPGDRSFSSKVGLELFLAQAGA